MFPLYILLHTTEHINWTVLPFPFHRVLHNTGISLQRDDGGSVSSV